MMHAYTDLNLTQLREEERVKALKRSDSSPNLRGGVASSAGKPFFEAQPFPENIFTDFAEEQMKVWMLSPERRQYRRIILQERLNYRAIQRKLRQDLLLAKSSFPPRMESEMIRSCLINQSNSFD